MSSLSFLLTLAVLTGAGGLPPGTSAPTLAAGQVWTVQARTAEGRTERWSLRLTSVEENRPERVTWNATSEGTVQQNAPQARLSLEGSGAGRSLLTAHVQTFDGRSQPDLQICLVVNPQQVATSWSGVYGVGLSGSRALNAYMAGQSAQNLGTCTLGRL